jgi:hypothetical protein
MAILQSHIKEEFESLLEKSNEEFNNGNYNDSIVLLEEAWDIIPDPKGIYCEESYHLVKDIISTCFMVNDLKKAKEWADKIFLTGFARIDSGDKEFIAGKVSFELGDLETTKDLLVLPIKNQRVDVLGIRRILSI